VIKAGDVVPLKWRLLDPDGTPITDLASAMLTVSSLTCSLGTTPNLPEEHTSELKNLGDGHYKLMWKTPRSYARSCKTAHLDLGEGVTRDAHFKLKR
jgi:hypothetical protein